MIQITRIESTQSRVVCYWNMSEVKEGKLKYKKENKENQSNNKIKQTDKMRKTKQNKEK